MREAPVEAPRPIVVVGTRRWHQILLLAYAAYAGGVYLHQPPPSVAAFVPPWEVTAWSVLLLVSGGIGAAASAWWRSVTAVRIAAGALLANVGALLLYVAAVFAALPDHWAVLRSGGWIVAWAVANLIEAVKFGRSMRGL